MFRMVANKLFLNLMEKNRFVHVNVSVSRQLTMLLIVLFSESFSEKKN